MAWVKNVSRFPVDVDNGAVISPGEIVNVTTDKRGPLAQELLDGGVLVRLTGSPDKVADKRRMDTRPETVEQHDDRSE